MSIDLIERMAELAASTKPQPPNGWEEKFIIHPGEVPWWEIEDKKERYKAYCRQWARMWERLHPGVDAETLRRYHKNHPEANAKRLKLRREEHPEYNIESLKRFSERHPGYFIEAAKCYNEKHPGAHAEALRRFHKTPKGRAALARHGAKRRKLSTDPATFGARVQQLRAMREPCNICGAPYNDTHEVDHIIALCNGGTDNWRNLQPLCISCHRKKTAEDAQKYKEKRKNNV